MTTTQQVKEKRGARAHAHEARAEQSIEFHADAGKNVNEHEFQAADCPQNSLCQFLGALTEGTIDSSTSHVLMISKLQQLE